MRDPSPSVRHEEETGRSWAQTLKAVVFKYRLPRINWCGPQLGTAWVHCNHIKVLKRNELYSNDHRKRGRGVLPAVVQQVWWQYRDEDVLPIHGIQHSAQRVHAGRQLHKETDSDGTLRLAWPKENVPNTFDSGEGCCLNVDKRKHTVLSLLAKMRMRLSNSMLA